MNGNMKVIDFNRTMGMDIDSTSEGNNKRAYLIRVLPDDTV